MHLPYCGTELRPLRTTNWVLCGHWVNLSIFLLFKHLLFIDALHFALKDSAKLRGEIQYRVPFLIKSYSYY